MNQQIAKTSAKTVKKNNLELSKTSFSKKRTILYALLLAMLTPFIFTVDFFSTSVHYSFTIFSMQTVLATFFLSLSFYLLLLVKIVIFFFIIRFFNTKFILSKRNLAYVLIGIVLLVQVLFYTLSFFNPYLAHDRTAQTIENNILKDIKVGMDVGNLESYLNSQTSIHYQKYKLIKLTDGAYVGKDLYDEFCPETNNIDKEYLKKTNIEYYSLSYSETNRNPLPYIYLKNKKVIAVSNENYDSHECWNRGTKKDNTANQLFN